MNKTATQEAPQPIAISKGFKQITGNTGASIFVLNKRADQHNSMGTLKEADLVPFTYQEILPILTKDEKLKGELKGKWFYLEGSGLNKESSLYTIDEKGELVEIKGNVSIENTVRVWNGTNPLSLDVYSDDVAALRGWRFFLLADSVPHVVAPVVVGKAKPNTQQNAAEQAKQLLRVEGEKPLILVVTNPEES
jgi:hypothetical protein